MSKEEPESYPPLLHTFPFPLSVSLPPSFPLLSFPPPPSSIAQSPTRRTRGQAMLLRCPFSLCGGRGLRPPERRRKSEKRLSSGNAPARPHPLGLGSRGWLGVWGGDEKVIGVGRRRTLCVIVYYYCYYLIICACVHVSAGLCVCLYVPFSVYEGKSFHFFSYFL